LLLENSEMLIKVFTGTTEVQQEGVELVVEVVEESDQYTATARLVEDGSVPIAEDPGVAPLIQDFGTPPQSIELLVENPQVAMFKEGLESWQDVLDAEDFPKGIVLVDKVKVYCSSGRPLKRTELIFRL
jgi:hypothetical protein